MAFALNKADLLRVEGMSNRDAAIFLGVGKTTVGDTRRRYKEYDAISPDWWRVVEATEGEKVEDKADAAGYSFEQKLDGSIAASTKPSEGPQTLEDAYQLLVDKKVDVSSYNIVYGYVEKELASGKVTHQYTMRATPKKGDVTAVQLDAAELDSLIDNYDYSPDLTVEETGKTFVICPSDMQVGKVSYHGGTTETIARVLASVGKAIEFLKENPVDEIIIAELGDPLENFLNVSSQRETNDLDMTGQVRVTRRLLLKLVKMLAPYARSVKYVTVPSNHGSVRIGFKAPAGDSHNDWGLEIAAQLEDAVRENPSLDHVTFVTPDRLKESVALTTSGTKLGFVHGHQSKGADKLGEWWKGQSHGNGPTKDADILLAGHWHSFRVYQSGAARWVFVSPASDPGSDWFTEITGEYSDSGMLSFTTSNGEWADLRIL